MKHESVDQRIVLLEFHAFKQEWSLLDSLRQIGGLSQVVKLGDYVIIHDIEGEELGKIKAVSVGDDVKSVVLRKATEEDLKLYEDLKIEAKADFEIFCKMLVEFDLKIKPIDVHYRFDQSKICFYIYSELHHDFRIFHRSIATVLRKRVAIKNVGVREYARFLGGLGPCGNELCCRTFLLETKPIHLRMARQQNLFVEPNKISGYCGKLCCCLRFEEEIYSEALTKFPRVGAIVETRQGRGKVIGIDIFNRKVWVNVEPDLELYIALDEVSGRK